MPAGGGRRGAGRWAAGRASPPDRQVRPPVADCSGVRRRWGGIALRHAQGRDRQPAKGHGGRRERVGVSRGCWRILATSPGSAPRWRGNLRRTRFRQGTQDRQVQRTRCPNSDPPRLSMDCIAPRHTQGFASQMPSAIIFSSLQENSDRQLLTASVEAMLAIPTRY